MITVVYLPITLTLKGIDALLDDVKANRMKAEAALIEQKRLAKAEKVTIG